MKHATVLFHDQSRDQMFSPAPGANGGGLYFPFRRLREVFLEAGVQLHTPDMNVGREVAFELHINARRRLPAVPCYAYLWEHPLIRPINGNRQRLLRYRHVFTWNTQLVDGQRIHELPIPNDLRHPQPNPGYRQRPLLCVAIAGNRALRSPDPRSLHDRRIDIIRWFDRHAPDDFALYGRGWNRPVKQPGVWGRAQSRLYDWTAGWRPDYRAFGCWRGAVDSKDSVLRQARFSLCFENLRGGPGYITEKLFDCLIYGCLPVYLGASDIGQRVPPECYLDGDAFEKPAALHEVMRAMGEDEFEWRRQRIAEFLLSEQARPYDDEHFCRTLRDHIARDLSLR